MRLSASYKLGNHTFGADVAQLKYTESGQVPGVDKFSEYKHVTWAVSWEAKWGGPWRTAIEWVRGTEGSCKLTIGDCSTDGLTGDLIGGGVAYDLDNQTFLYVIAAVLKNGDSARYDNWAASSPARGADVSRPRSAWLTGSRILISCRRTGAAAPIPVYGGGLTMLRSLVTAALVAPALALAQAKPGPHSDLYMYQGADRDAKLLAGAKKESRSSMYTSLNPRIGADHRGLREEVRRQGRALALLQREGAAARGHRGRARAASLRSMLRDQRARDGGDATARGCSSEFHSPHFSDLPPAAFPKHRQ